MNYIDIILCIPLTWGLYKGFVKGLILEAASIVAFGLGVYISINYSELLSTKFTEWFNWHFSYLKILSFVVAFLGAVIFVFFVAKIVQKLTEGIALGGINKIVGALFGSLKYALMISVVIFIIDSLEKSYPFISFENKNNSILYKPVGMIAPMIIPGLKNAKMIPFNSSESDENKKSE